MDSEDLMTPNALTSTPCKTDLNQKEMCQTPQEEVAEEAISYISIVDDVTEHNHNSNGSKPVRSSNGLSIKRQFSRLEVTLGSRHKEGILELDALQGTDEKDGWGYKMEFLITCISLGLALPNVWRLPTLARANGDGVFLLVWAILMWLLGLPLLFLELEVAFFSNKCPTEIWKAVPLSRGLGYAQLLVCAILAWYFPTIGSFSFFYVDQALFDLARETPLLDRCYNRTKSACECYVESVCDNTSTTLAPGEVCFLDDVAVWKYGSSNGLEYNFWHLIGLAFIFLITFLGCIKGVKSIGKMSTVLFLATLAFHVGLLIYLINETGGSQGAAMLFDYSDFWTRIGDANLWLAACVQVILSLHLTSGIMIALASRTRMSPGNIIQDTMTIFVPIFAFGLSSIFLVYSWLGVVEMSNNEYSTAYSLSFVFATFHHAAVVAFDTTTLPLMCFFSYITLASITSNISLVYTLSLALQDVAFPNEKLPFWKLVAFTCTLFFLLSLTTFSSGSLPLFVALDSYAISATIVILTLLFVLTFIHVYGVKRLQRDLLFWTIPRTRLPISILLGMLSVPVPIILLAFDLMGFFAVPLNGSENCKDPDWVVGLGWSLYLLAISLVVITAVVVVSFQYEYGLREKLKSSIKSDRDWGPKDPIIQHQWHQSFHQLDAESETRKSSVGADSSKNKFGLSFTYRQNMDDTKF